MIGISTKNFKGNVASVVKSRLIADSGTYFFFRIVESLVPVLLLPVVTRKLTPEEYGVFVLFTALSGVLLPLMTLSMDSSIVINYFKIKKDFFASYFSTAYLACLSISILFAFIVLLLKSFIYSITSFPSEWIWALVIFCFLQFNSNLTLSLFQVKREAKKYGLFSIVSTILRNGLALFLILMIGMKWNGLIIGHVIGYFFLILFSYYLFFSKKLFVFDVKKEYLMDSIKVGGPISLHLVGSWLAGSATRIIVGGILGTAAAGSFGIGATLGFVVALVHDSFNKAFVPYLFDLLNRYDSKVEKYLIKLTYMYNCGLLVFALGVGILGYYFVGMIFGPAYGNADGVVLLVSLACAFDGMYKMHSNYLFYTKKTHMLFFITVTTGSLNILFSYVFVSVYGLVGGALSLCLVNLLGFVIAWYLGNRVFPMRWFQRIPGL